MNIDQIDTKIQHGEHEYTDEPWIVDEVTNLDGPFGAQQVIYMVNHVYKDADPTESDHTDEIAEIVMEYPGKMSRNNACRIVACVNSCAGINPYAIPHLLSIIRRVMAVQDDLVPSWIKQMCEEVHGQVKALWVPGKELS